MSIWIVDAETQASHSTINKWQNRHISGYSWYL